MVEGASSIKRPGKGVGDLLPSAGGDVCFRISLLLHFVNSANQLRVRQTQTFVIKPHCSTKVHPVSTPCVTIHCAITIILSATIGPPPSDTITGHAIVWLNAVVRLAKIVILKIAKRRRPAVVCGVLGLTDTGRTLLVIACTKSKPQATPPEAATSGP